ncbi:MAG: lysostaphin resistance A-like protein [Planctomycetota bacterium]|jgi:membrane protease YdiL (CAAX protease family)
MPMQDPSELLMSLLVGVVELAIFVLVVILAVLDRRVFAKHWRKGLVVGLVVFAMLVPVTVFNIAYFDPAAMLEKMPSSAPEQTMMLAVYVGLVVGLVFRVLAIGWHIVVYCVAVAEWKRLGLSAFPLMGARGDGERDGSAGDVPEAEPALPADARDPPSGPDERAHDVGLPPLAYEPAVADAGIGTDEGIGPGGRPDRDESHAPPSERPCAAGAARRGVVAAALFGVVAGVASCIVFDALDVKESETFRRFVDSMFPNIESASPWVRMSVFLSFAMAAAVAEELTFRGVVMGFVQRLSPGRTMAIAAATVSASLWAVEHLNITNAPMVKFAQILLLGFAFAWFARRYRIEAAIAAHLGLNVAAVLVGFWMGLGP